MASPFAEYANATLTFQISAATDEYNAAGNRIFTTTTEVVTAFLKKDNAPQYTKPEGIKVAADHFGGYCVDPMQLPTTIKPGATITATISGEAGTFYMDSLINPPYGRAGIGELVGQETGTKIGGWFVRST